MRARMILVTAATAIGCVGAVGPANAQVLAAKAGMNVSNISQNATFSPDDELESSTGLMVSVEIRHALHNMLELQIEGVAATKGNSPDNHAGGLHDSIVINYIEVPMLARFGVFQRDRNTISIHGGPTFAFNAGAHEMNNGVRVKSPLQLKSFDIGLAIGAQVELTRIIIGGRYTIGLANILADDPALFGFSEMKNRALTLFAGYRLR